MVAINNTNRADLPTSDFPEIPSGEYLCVVQSISEDIHKKVPMKYLKVKLQILEGQYKNSLFFEDWYGLIAGTEGQFVNVVPSFNIEKASQVRFGEMLDALNLKGIANTDPMVGQAVMVKVVLKDGRTNVRGYKPSAPTAAQAAPAANTGQAPAANTAPAPAATQPAAGGGW